MILEQVLRIGKCEMENLSPYQVLIDRQKKYKAEKILVVNINPEEPLKEELDIFEADYDPNKSYEYASGSLGGTSPNASPTLSINWSHIKAKMGAEELEKVFENPKKVLNFDDKLFKTFSRVDPSNYKETLVESVYSWLETHGLEFRRRMVSYLHKVYIEGKVKKSNQPGMVVFAIWNPPTGNYQLPGEIESFKKFYVEIHQICSGGGKGAAKCHFCNQMKPRMNPFSLGFLTFDHRGFGLYFQKKDVQTLFVVCPDCRLILQNGASVLENDLRFYAYSFKRGKDNISVSHYIIPLVHDDALLKKILKRIRRVRKQINQARAAQTDNKIQTLSSQLTLAKGDQARGIRDRLKSLRENKERFETNVANDIEIAELVESLGSEGISYIDLYFYETDLKLYPTSKEVVNVFYVRKTRVEQIAKALGKLKRNYNLRRIHFWHLKDLIGNRAFPWFLEALFTEHPIDKKRFLVLSENRIRHAFLNHISDLQEEYFSQKLTEFQVFFDLLDETRTLR
ncbi:MAG: TM1802 family CRISPR-associated protein [Candidatus Heimdallarchaeota archaeon]